MEVEPVGRVPTPRRPLQVVGVTADLAAARRKLREVTPDGHWDAVLAEVSRLQNEQHLSPLAALQGVYANLASGWVPAIRK